MVSLSKTPFSFTRLKIQLDQMMGKRPKWWENSHTSYKPQLITIHKRDKFTIHNNSQTREKFTWNYKWNFLLSKIVVKPKVTWCVLFTITYWQTLQVNQIFSSRKMIARFPHYVHLARCIYQWIQQIMRNLCTRQFVFYTYQ